MLVRDAVALDAVDAAGTHVQQQIDQAVGQQVHFVDIQNALVGLGQQPRAELHGAVLERGFQVQ
ncbi:hypothetical protein D3C78_1478300 [compost metagenome]